MSIRLYGYWRSSASYRVRIALNLKQLDYDYCAVHLTEDGGEQHKEDYFQLNPSKLVPTFVDEDDDITLHQSLAIIEYLDEKYDQGEELIPSHKLDRARVRMLSQDIACDIQPIVNLRVLKKLKSDYHADDKQINAWVRHWIEKGFDAITKKLETRSGKFCYGYSLSMIDVCLVPQVYGALRFGVNMADYPLLQRLYNNCMAIDAFREASPENQSDADI